VYLYDEDGRTMTGNISDIGRAKFKIYESELEINITSYTYKFTRKIWVIPKFILHV
jgi:hypothetical protein